MALAMVNPFTYAAYCQQIQEFAEWMTEYVQKNKINSIKGWVAHFTSYHPGCWQSGVKTRRDFHKTITASLGTDQSLLNVANKIVVGFGGINRPYKINGLAGIRGALVILFNEKSNPAWFKKNKDHLCFSLNTPRISSHSKLYEMFDPNKWTIYDSRVATALVCLVHKYWSGKGHNTASGYLSFPVPPRNLRGRPWQRPYPNQFPGVNTHQQAVLSFIYASWLLRKVAEILNADPKKYGCPPTIQHPGLWAPLDAKWAVYSVEMALWMMGDKKF
jgi:hypothetical protein